MPMVLLCCNMDSKLRRVLPQMIGKALLFCRRMQFIFRSLWQRLGMFLSFLVHLLFVYPMEEKQRSFRSAAFDECTNDKDDISFKKK